MAEVIPEDRRFLAAEVAELVHSVGHRVRHDLRDRLAETGVTWAQLRALRTIARSDEPLLMSGLADRLQIARRSATSFVDELEGRGLVRRAGVDGDRRATAIELTEAGAALLSSLDDHRRRAAEQVLSPLTDAELRAVRRALGRIAN